MTSCSKLIVCRNILKPQVADDAGWVRENLKHGCIGRDQSFTVNILVNTSVSTRRRRPSTVRGWRTSGRTTSACRSTAARSRRRWSTDGSSARWRRRSSRSTSASTASSIRRASSRRSIFYGALASTRRYCIWYNERIFACSQITTSEVWLFNPST